MNKTKGDVTKGEMKKENFYRFLFGCQESFSAMAVSQIIVHVQPVFFFCKEFKEKN